MRRLGTAFSESRNELVVAAEFAPRMGSKVVDRGMKVVGDVLDLFGSVEKPFVAVDDGETVETGEPLYVL
ncbi:MAG: hypothetical protein MAG715_00838 [Methanonatronarchaeales archaeon]|nr:hypothetical protein [Methanonatronarchaeales archaeon]